MEHVVYLGFIPKKCGIKNLNGCKYWETIPEYREVFEEIALSGEEIDAEFVFRTLQRIYLRYCWGKGKLEKFNYGKGRIYIRKLAEVLYGDRDAWRIMPDGRKILYIAEVKARNFEQEK